MKNKNTQAGFTLVEMGIVVVIIALLVGGVLKGREVLSEAQITSTISSISNIDIALKGFKELYDYLPGDIPATPGAAGILPNCTIAPCATNGDGDFLFDNAGGGALGVAPTSGSEGHVAFLNLAAAGLYSGISANGGITFGSGLPRAPIGGGFWLGSSPDSTSSSGQVVPVGNYLVLHGAVANMGADTRLTPEQAAQIDIRMDDGQIAEGIVRQTGTGACNFGGQYNRADPRKSCSLYIKVLDKILNEI